MNSNLATGSPQGEKAAVPVAVRRTRRSVRVKEIRSGSMSAASAARVIRALRVLRALVDGDVRRPFGSGP